jgi:anti-sigma regulatory factor (Ser/Thr protein kinase)
VEDISLHILDIAENSIRADATRIEILLARDAKRDSLRVEVNDNGRGMDPGTLARVRDPFFTTKGKRTGLGIPLLAQAAEQTNGTVSIDSAPGKGTRVSITFTWSHVDRPAIGNMADTLLALITGHADREYVYEEREDGRFFRFDTREIKDQLGEVPIDAPEAIAAIRELLNENMRFAGRYFKSTEEVANE